MQKERRLSKKIKVVLVVSFFCAASILLYSVFSKVDKYKVLVLSTDEYLIYKEFTNQWFSMTQKEFLDKKYNKDSHTLYLGSNKIGTFKYKMIDQNLELVNETNNVVVRYKNKKWYSYGGNSYVNNLKFTNSKLVNDDDFTIFNFLEKEKLASDYNVSYLKKYKIDFDGDTKKENIFIISNLVDNSKEYINYDARKIFSFMFLEKDGKFKKIYSKVVDQDNINNICLPSFEGAMTIGRNQKIVISYCEYLTQDTYKLNLYNYNGAKFNNIGIN